MQEVFWVSAEATCEGTDQLESQDKIKAQKAEDHPLHLAMVELLRWAQELFFFFFFF